MPQHDDFQVFEVVRAKAQDRELKKPPKDDVREREATSPPEQPNRRPILRVGLTLQGRARPGAARLDLCTLQADAAMSSDCTNNHYVPIW